MFRPISEQSSANVLPSRFVRPEGLNKFSVEMYLAPNFLKLYLQVDTAQPTEVVSVFLLAFLPLTSFVGESPFDANSLLSAMHATTTRRKTITFTPMFSRANCRARKQKSTTKKLKRNGNKIGIGNIRNSFLTNITLVHP